MDALSSGRLIGWDELALAFGQIVLLLGRDFCAGGHGAFSPARTGDGAGNPMNSRAKKILLLLLAAALLAGSGQMQKVLNRDREQLGLTRTAVLENAPPVLAFTTVALGGFRGLISNFLWIRANDLQQDDKFFEAAQLADLDHGPGAALHAGLGVSGLEHGLEHFGQVQGFSRPLALGPARHRTAARRRPALQSRRDDALPQLGWIFQHKMGQNLDDANMYYKQQWAKEMTPFFGASGTNFAELLNPTTAAARTNALVLREKYKMDPAFAKKVDEKYGPFDWRLPEAHAIYWGARGLDSGEGKSRQGEGGRLDHAAAHHLPVHAAGVSPRAHHRGSVQPNLLARPRTWTSSAQVNNAYDQMYAEETSRVRKTASSTRTGISCATRFIFFTKTTAWPRPQKWFKYLGEKYPDKPIIENQPDSLPKNLTLDEYAVAVVQIDIGETSQERVTAAIEGLLARSYYALAIGEDDRSANLQAARPESLSSATPAKLPTFGGDERIPLPPFDVLNQPCLSELLDPQNGLPYAARAVLRTQLGLPAETNAPPPNHSTNTTTAVVNTVSTEFQRDQSAAGASAVK